MNNANAKNRFFDFIESDGFRSINVYKIAFDTVSQFENLYNKDACNFNSSEIDNMYKTLNIKMLTGIRNLNSLLLKYTSWCQKESLVIDGINHYEEFYGDRMYNYINMQYVQEGILSREEVLEIAKQMLNPMDSFALIATFEGFGGVAKSDFFNARLNHIEGNKMTLSNRVIEVSDELIEYANISAAQDVYLSRVNERYDTQLESDETLIYKDKSTQDNNITRNRTITDRLTREFKALGFENLSYADIVKSGRVHFIKANAAKYGISPKEYCSKYPDQIANQFGRKPEYIPVMYTDLKPFLE